MNIMADTLNFYSWRFLVVDLLSGTEFDNAFVVFGLVGVEGIDAVSNVLDRIQGHSERRVIGMLFGRVLEQITQQQFISRNSVKKECEYRTNKEKFGGRYRWMGMIRYWSSDKAPVFLARSESTLPSDGTFFFNRSETDVL